MTGKKWQCKLPSVVGDTNSLVDLLLESREIVSDVQKKDFLSDNPTEWHDPFLFQDMKEAVDITVDAISNDAKILVNGELRIIDYKTGKDLTKFSDVDDLFDTNEHDDVKAILQLFLYAIAYHQLNPDCGPIKIGIYKLNKIEESGVSFGSCNDLFACFK